MHLPVNRITMSKLPICTPTPWENIMSICNSKRVPPPTRDLKYFLHIDPRKDLESVTHKNSKWIPSISHTDHNLNQFCELGAKEHTWLCGTLTCTGELRSSLSPTPTCPNCKIEKVLTISTALHRWGLLWDKLPWDSQCRPGQNHDWTSPTVHWASGPAGSTNQLPNWTQSLCKDCREGCNPFWMLKDKCSAGGAQFSHMKSWIYGVHLILVGLELSILRKFHNSSKVFFRELATPVTFCH